MKNGFEDGDMLDDRIAIVGRAGYGKTNAANGASTPSAIEADTGMSPDGGTYKTYMGRLKRLGIVEGSGREGFTLQEDLR